MDSSISIYVDTHDHSLVSDIEERFPDADVSVRSELGGLEEIVKILLPFTLKVAYDIIKYLFSRDWNGKPPPLSFITIEIDGKKYKIPTKDLTEDQIKNKVEQALK